MVLGTTQQSWYFHLIRTFNLSKYHWKINIGSDFTCLIVDSIIPHDFTVEKQKLKLCSCGASRCQSVNVALKLILTMTECYTAPTSRRQGRQ